VDARRLEAFFWSLGGRKSRILHRPALPALYFFSPSYLSCFTPSPAIISMESTQGNEETVFVESLSSLTVQDSSAAPDHPQPLPPHLSHDPENNLKRSDPFQFGSRLLSQEDDVFEFNAWDHVETDDAYKEYAELQYAKQREAPVSDFDKSMSIFSSLPVITVLPDDLKNA
jgi:hypothetical protein